MFAVIILLYTVNAAWSHAHSLKKNSKRLAVTEHKMSDIQRFILTVGKFDKVEADWVTLYPYNLTPLVYRPDLYKESYFSVKS